MKSKGFGRMFPRSQAVMYRDMEPPDFCLAFQESVKVVAIGASSQVSQVSSTFPKPPCLECSEGSDVDFVNPSSTFCTF